MVVAVLYNINNKEMVIENLSYKNRAQIEIYQKGGVDDLNQGRMNTQRQEFPKKQKNMHLR